MDKIKTATGKIFNSDFLSTITNPDLAYIRIVGSDIATVAAIFSNPSETVQLWHNDTYLAQYTRLEAIVPENGCIRIVLGKE